ncbi:MAG: aspartate carbamoyltransferase catalytic subunit [Proteobacteria bacterium]|nr:aspartate carbamoyltransferase catalytic subunit [Pseudomonadota bacterium]
MLISTAFSFRQRADGGKPIPPTLSGKSAILLFFEASTRTRSSFEMAVQRLGGNAIVLTQQGSSAEKGETLLDTARTIQAMNPDILVLRHPSAGSPYLLDRELKLPIINAGDGFHEHPTQALLDLMTIFEMRKKIEGTRVLIVGDIAHSRVARSNIYALKTMGAEVSVCGPPTLLPPKIEKMGVQVFQDLEKAVLNQDVIMMLRIQFERLNSGQSPSRGEYARFYGMNRKLLKLCKPNVLIMHPGPINRGVELATEVADGAQSVILNQVSNGVLLRMAALHLLLGGEPFSWSEEIK